MSNVDTSTLALYQSNLAVDLPLGGDIQTVLIRKGFGSIIIFAGPGDVDFSFNSGELDSAAAPPTIGGPSIPRNNAIRIFMDPFDEVTLYMVAAGGGPATGASIIGEHPQWPTQTDRLLTEIRDLITSAWEWCVERLSL